MMMMVWFGTGSQGIGGLVKPMEELVAFSSTTTSSTISRSQVMERGVKPRKEQALNCPRCNSINTKFCYYNNYSVAQPRYFCKTCRRYWTKGGSLRNVPVGGGSRKNKISSSTSVTTSTITAETSTSTASSSTKLTPPPISLSSFQNLKFHEGQDLNLTFPNHILPHKFSDFPTLDNPTKNTHSSGDFSNMELLRSGMSGRPPPPPFVQMPGTMYSAAGFGLQDLRPPTLSFPLDGAGGGDGGGYGAMQGIEESVGRLLFPLEDLRQVPSPSDAVFEQNRQQGGDPPGFWNQMIGDGASW